MEKQRTYIAIDLKSFYASADTLHRSIKGLKVYGDICALFFHPLTSGFLVSIGL